MIKQYRKKPVVIEALQWKNNPEEMAEFLTNGCKFRITHEGEDKDDRVFNLRIHTLEGVHEASHLDYIIKGVKGEFYPCKPDIFEMTYERVD